ncbi:MAG: Ig-like domain-containing protein [Acidobacteriaceae bacterium]
MLRTFSRVSLFLLAAVPLISAQSPTIPGKFYEYYTVASTQGGTFTAVGPPSINDNGLCAFTGTTSAGQTIWVSDGHFLQPRDINPGQANLGRNFFDPQLQINTNNQVIAKDFVQGVSQNIRLWDANFTDSFVYLARSGNSQPYTALNGAPSVNANGDGVFGAINGTAHELVEVSNGVPSTFAINSSTPQPAIDAAGDMVVTTTNRGTGLNQVILFRNGFTSQTQIASGSDFSYLDTTPGISDDGNVVVFQGTLTTAGATHLGLTAGAGIFASVNTGSAWQVIRATGLMVEVLGSGGNDDGICDPGETCKNAAELGYDDNNNPIDFSSYPTNSRVAVTNVDFGAAGIADDTFVISFMGTPSHASRTNPVTKNTPLLFSGNTGLWTIRVDVKNQLVAPNGLVFHPYTAIPVVQVGDQLGTNNIITALSVNMQIANAAEDEFGVVRTMRRGDHRIAFQATVNGSAQTIFRANHLDSSQDGLLDHWKTSGIDMDQDGIPDLNLAGMGAFVGQRDLFVQMDWLSDQTGYNFRPAPGVVTAVGGGAGDLPQMLANAPALSGNMYGVRRDGLAPAVIPIGITMHIDGGSGADFYQGPYSYRMGTGPLDGGKQIGMPGNNAALVEVLYLGVPGSITVPGVNTRAFQDVKDNFFGSQDKDARELAFKYAVLADHYTFVDSPPANHPISGAGPNYILVGDPYPAGLSSGEFIKITTGTGAGQTLRITGFDKVIANKMYVAPFYAAIPDTSSTFAYISGSSGVSEVFFYPDPDNNSLPGNDFMLTLGDWGVNPGGYLMNECSQWRTLAHEMGHTLGLRHGGVDQQTMNANYLSLMSYSHQLVCNPASQVQGYSGTLDPVFDDFANLNHQFAQVFLHTGNSLGMGFGAVGEQAQQAPEQNVQDYINQNGPIDFVKPVVAITSPTANSQVSTGGPLTVTIQATDNASIAKVKATFDANGDGTVGPSEIVTAQSSGGNLYTATFSSISGSLSPRTLTAIATDTSGNTATTSISLNVGNGSQFALSVTEAGTGTGAVSSSPTGISCPSTCSANFNSGTAVTLTPAAGTGSTFAGWSGACTGTGSCSVTMSQARAVTATFNHTAVQFALTVTKAGTETGTVKSAPAGISCPSTCSANFNSGTVVTLTATAGTGATFAGWSGACSGTGSCSVTMSQARAVTATFNHTAAQLALTGTEAGTRAVSSSPAGISCPSTCSANYNSGTVVTLTATAGTGATFAGWSGACTGTGSCSVTMSQARAVTASEV